MEQGECNSEGGKPLRSKRFFSMEMDVGRVNLVCGSKNPSDIRRSKKIPMALSHIVIRLLSAIIPPKKHQSISDEFIARYEPRFKKMYRWHTLVGVLLLFGIPGLLYLCSGFLEAIWYVKQPDALFTFTPGKGLLGIAIGMMLGFGVSVPLAHWVIKGYLGADIMELYDVWYDSRPNHPLNSKALGRGMLFLFIPLAIWAAAYFRYDYTFVTQEKIRYGNPWRFTETVAPLAEIRAIEMQIGKIAPNGDYNPGFRYRIRLENREPWESPFFTGSAEPNHLQFRPMIDFVLQKTGLEMVEIATPRK
jgi:hypothetical protein